MTDKRKNRNRPVLSSLKRWKIHIIVVVLVAVYFVIFYTIGAIQPTRELQNRKQINTLVSSEELILQLTPRLKDLTRSVLNLQFPDHESHALLDDRIDVIGLDTEAKPRPIDKLGTVKVTKSAWPVGKRGRVVPSKQVSMWRGLLETIDYFEHAKFYFIRGQVSDTDAAVFQTDLGFAGLAVLKNGQRRAVKAKQEIHWRRQASASDDKKPRWRIFSWHLKSMETTDSERLLFDEVLDQALPDDQARARARNSPHGDLVIGFAKTGQIPLENERYRRHFDQPAGGQHPGLSVVDVDNDGWDDLYVMVRWGRNQFLHNQGDGTFVERAAPMGLDIDGVSTSGVFADFDNDGDKDLMLGRTLQRSMYLVNEDGRFVDRSKQLVSIPLPYLVTSVSAVDYNGDGLLDVFLSTYGRPGGGEQAETWGPEFLPPAQAAILVHRFKDPEVGHNRFINRVGPPNVLLAGRGDGRFEVAPENDQVMLWHNSFQATWSDFDEDGDPDLYVSNDFAPDYLFRNNGPDGFVDITEEAGGETMLGFGMGVSWGDYDNDGRQDLYISNMYSKAGMRITDQIPNLDPRFPRSADGNRLYRGVSNGFELVSGREPPAMQVTQAGWSWGGQFVDLDNDGFQDIYVPSGYDTVPEEIATEVDL